MSNINCDTCEKITSEEESILVINEQHVDVDSVEIAKPNASKKCRFFKLVDQNTGNSSGRYTGTNPEEAAKKAYTHMLMSYKEKCIPMSEICTISIKESTRGSEKNIYTFQVERVKLETPEQISVLRKNGNYETITYEYRNRAKEIETPIKVINAVSDRRLGFAQKLAQILSDDYELD